MSDIAIKVYEGNDNCLLIVTGINATIDGYQNKYKTIANDVLSQYGYSVVIATLKKGALFKTKAIMTIIMNQLKEKNYQHMYAMGISAGANIIAIEAHHYKNIDKLLLINPVLTINIHHIKSGLTHFEGEKTLICGDQDPSYKYTNILNNYINMIILENVDHYFTDNLALFKTLPHKYLF